MAGGKPLPSPRKVTALVHRDHDHPHTDATILLMSWGQLIDHDLALAAPPRGEFTCHLLSTSFFTTPPTSGQSIV